MKYITVDEMRSMFLKFFESKQHQILPSASLVPQGDASLLLTGAGMVPFKPYFLGQEVPTYKRVTTCQRCLRTPDIDNVGKTDRHGTFFEMLGNFSFGDYFKEEAITWAWEFITEHLELPVDRLWVSVYHDDDEAYEIWTKKIGVSPDKMVRLGKEHNFWEIGVGYPGGPCSEIHFDRGAEHGCDDPNCKPGCDCDRFLEFWNLVFIQYLQVEPGKFEPLASKSIDTGMGMERIAALIQGVKSIFEVDIVRPIIDKIAELAGTSYGADPEKDVSLRVITDHARGLTFLVHDGVLPSNEGRGYVLRRLLRRAARHGRLLGIEGQFLLEVVDVVIEQMKQGYPELEERRDYIHKVVSLEENRFHETLDQGINLLQEIIDQLKAEEKALISGEDVFRLYDTYGFPLELTKEIAAEHGLEIDEAGVTAAMEEQRRKARAARTAADYTNKHGELYKQLLGKVNTEFVGYQHLEYSSKVLALIKDDQFVDQLTAGEQGIVILEKTPFYAEAGGQVADTGTITAKVGQFQVKDVRQPVESIVIHQGVLNSGNIKVGEEVLATVSSHERMDIARHHSATHLLHKALRDVLGDHVYQSGSSVDVNRLRFDFTHFEAVTKEQLALVEQKVNEMIMANNSVQVENMSMEEAKAAGAMALFGEKYANEVRVITMGESKELCGGTHVSSTGEIGLFRIISEGSVAAGVRRIEAVAGKQALKYMDEREKILMEIAGNLNTKPENVVDQLNRLLEQQKQLEQELNQLKKALAGDLVEELVKNAEQVANLNLLVTEVDITDHEELRELGDRLRDKLNPAVVFLGAKTSEKVSLLGMASKNTNVHVGNVIKEAAKICGGGGGGRPDMAQAGGRMPEKLDEALAKAKELVLEQLKVSP